MCLGHGGVFVVQPPYLLFYPDRDGDDVPDGDPEVLLTGFGMEDAHAVRQLAPVGPGRLALRGPGQHGDGRTFAASSSSRASGAITRGRSSSSCSPRAAATPGASISTPRQRHRRHELRRRRMLHQVQGGYYIKSFGKHGALHNPHAYGYFDHVPCADFQGGHVTFGGIVYQGGRFPRSSATGTSPATSSINRLLWHELDAEGVELHGSPRRRVPDRERPLVPAGRLPGRSRRGRLRRRLVRPAGQPRRPDRQLGPQQWASVSGRPKGHCTHPAHRIE